MSQETIADKSPGTNANCDYLCFCKYGMHKCMYIYTLPSKGGFCVLFHLTLDDLFVEMWREQPKAMTQPWSLWVRAEHCVSQSWFYITANSGLKGLMHFTVVWELQIQISVTHLIGSYLNVLVPSLSLPVFERYLSFSHCYVVYSHEPSSSLNVFPVSLQDSQDLGSKFGSILVCYDFEQIPDYSELQFHLQNAETIYFSYSTELF